MIASLGNHLKNITTSVLLKTGRNFVSLFFSSLVNTQAFFKVAGN